MVQPSDKLKKNAYRYDRGWNKGHWRSKGKHGKVMCTCGSWFYQRTKLANQRSFLEPSSVSLVNSTCITDPLYLFPNDSFSDENTAIMTEMSPFGRALNRYTNKLKEMTKIHDKSLKILESRQQAHTSLW